MSLVHEQTIAEAPKPLPAFRYMSFDVVGTPIGFERAIGNGLATIAAEAWIKINDEEALKVYAQARTHPQQGVRCPGDLGRFYSVMAAHFGHRNTEEQASALRNRVAGVP